jgi:hypothetical protein
MSSHVLRLWLLLAGLQTVSASAICTAEEATAAARVALELAFLDHAGTLDERESVAVRILTSGDVLVPDDAHPQRILRVADRLTAEQLAALLDDAVVRPRLERIDSRRLHGEVQAACRAAGLTPEIAGAATTIVRFRSQETDREARCAALSVAAARFPDLTDVQQLFHAQLRLQNVAAVARVGGEVASRRLAEIANQSLRRLHPDAVPMTPRDLSMVRELATGSRYVQFYRRSEPRTQELLVSIFETPGEPPRVDVLVTPSP